MTTTTTALRKPRRKWHGACIYKVREVLSPINKDYRGLRILVAVPNMAGHKAFSSVPAPSFHKAYLLFQSSDYNSDALQTQLPKHIQWLLNRGFEKVEPAEEFEARMLLEMSKGQRVEHVDLEGTEA